MSTERTTEVQVTTRRHGDLAVADLQNLDELFDEAALAALGERLYRLADEANEAILVNLGGTSHLSSGLIARLARLRRLQPPSRRIMLCGVDRHLRHTLQLCGLDSCFELYDDETQALAAHDGGA